MLQPDIQNGTTGLAPSSGGPTLAPVHPQRALRGVRTGAIVALTVLLAVVFGVGLFAG